MVAYMQKLGKSLMLPIAVLPICAILLGIGYALAPASMGSGGDVEGIAYYVGSFLVTCGKALIDNIAILFVIGVGVGMAKKHDGTAALAALVSWLVFTTVLKVDFVQSLFNIDNIAVLAFTKINNPFIGILAGLIGSGCFNKFSNFKPPEFLAFFGGKRFVAIASVLVSVLVSIILFFVWPYCFNALVAFGTWITSLGGVGVGIYMLANRLLIPTGLHHALNNVFWFDTIGIGDLTNFWAGKTSDDVSWDLGMYMSGFFPCIMFGIPGAALGMILASKHKKKTFGVLGSIALCAFLCGVTEPFEFIFVFIAFPLYVIYAILFGIFGVITYYVEFRAGFSFSAGLLDLVFSASLPAAKNTLLIIPLGIAAFIVFFIVFYLYVKKFKVEVVGTDDVKEAVGNVANAASNVASNVSAKVSGNDEFAVMAKGILDAIGGVENIEESDHCVTRLRLTIKDASKVDEEACKKAGAKGVMKPSKNACQVIIGPKVEFVFNEFIKLTGEDE